MGGNSTLHSAALSDKKAPKSFDFDLQSWQGLTAVLKLGKESLTEPSEYAAFRNLVLQYAQQGGDPEIKKRILVVLNSFTEVPVPEATAEVLPEVEPPHSILEDTLPDLLPHTIHEEVTVPEVESAVITVPKKEFSTVGVRRMAPRFDTVSTKNNLEEETSGDTKKVITNEEKKVVEEPVLAVPVPEAALKLEPEEAVKEVIPEVSVVPEPTPVSLNVTEHQSVPKPVSIEAHKARITEIKHAVRTHFGNPAALVDMRNEAGKSYMKSLLFALKAIGPGSDANADVAMAELEASFKALVVASGGVPDSGTQVSEKVEEELHVPEVPVVEEPVEEKVIERQAPIAQERETEPEPEEVVEKSVPEITEPEIMAVPVPPAPIVPDQEEEIKESAVPLPRRTLADLSTPGVSRMSPVAREAHTLLSGDATPSETGVGELSSKVPVSRFEENNVVVKQSELVSEEITTALRRLLHDWNIFSGSGLFGIGPGGIDHPLYRRLAPLTMGEIIAGRWEKSDPKIVKIIKEYVDAWRHEQGVAYTINETFEHYLRRVIQRILKRQGA